MEINKTKVSLEKNKLIAIQDKLENDSETYINDKLNHIQSWVDKLPNRKAIKKGNITMREYLSSLKKEIELDKPSFILKEKNMINQCLTDIDKLETEELETYGS